MYEFWLKISLTFVPKGPVDNILALAGRSYQIPQWDLPCYSDFTKFCFPVVNRQYANIDSGYGLEVGTKQATSHYLNQWLSETMMT